MNNLVLIIMVSDEVLSEVIIMYPCIYDKKDPGHMDKVCVSNAWKDVVEKCGGNESVSDVQKQFTNLKKRYQKKRSSVRNLPSFCFGLVSELFCFF